MERIPELLTRMDRMERDMEEHSRSWRSTVDDIKSIIKSEISDLKTEQIGDLKQAIKDRESAINSLNNRLRGMEDQLRDWNARGSVVTWIIRTGIAVGGLVAGWLTGKHLG